MNTKVCRVCKQLKPLIEFYKDVSRTDGLANKCKACTKEWDKGRNRNRKEYSLSYRANHPEMAKRVKRKYRQANKEKVRAHLRIQHEILVGRLPRITTCICESCGCAAQEYHHPDYSKPLEVKPLCRKCHRAIHYPQRATV